MWSATPYRSVAESQRLDAWREVRSGPHASTGISGACRKRALKKADKYFDRLGAIK